MRLLTLQDFDYPFPEHLIAQTPADAREHARLLVRPTASPLRHCHVSDLTSELPRGALLILNDTRVFPSRLFGQLETGGKIEIFLLEEHPAQVGVWKALGRPLKKLRDGTPIKFGHGLSGRALSRAEQQDGTAYVLIELSLRGEELARWLEEHAQIPLPPYIKRTPNDPEPLQQQDRERYQTVYARERGSVAAPTAGLHFTDALLAGLRARGVTPAYVSLHVGAGTFLPVKAQDVSLHKMHSERFVVPRETVEQLLAARREGRKVVAVGTTSFRCIESLYRQAGAKPEAMLELADQWRTTELFVYPKHAEDVYRPWVIDALMTNFHQPCSTLFMLISALIGLREAKELYAEAVAREYRLYSYGDSSLLWLQ